MKRVGVMVVLAYDAIVGEDDIPKARRLGEQVIACELARLGVSENNIKDIEATDVFSEPDDARASTNTCHWCKTEAPKPAWGPGYMCCPSCKKRPPSVAELSSSLTL